jgi:hypothetical protein
MKRLNRRNPLALAVLAFVSSAGWAALQGRDLDRDPTTFEAYYDTVLDVTWLADWNLAQSSGYHFDGAMSWQEAMDWAEGLKFHGLKGWRLPTVSPVNGTSFNLRLSYDGSTDRGYAKAGTGWGTATEMGHLHYVTLGLDSAVAGDAHSGAAPFFNVQDAFYWSGTELDANPNKPWGYAWGFQPMTGAQNFGDKTGRGGYAVAVRPGDVTSSIPEPATWLTLSLGLGVIASRLGRKAVLTAR